MSDGDKNVTEIHDEDDVNYKPPPEKSLKEIVEADQNDASLQKYKEALLGQAIKEPVIVGMCFCNIHVIKDNIFFPFFMLGP